ncbi:hypothetical protein [Streptomyces europaeiscabiei]|uniref:hypothetical protein n=1 Tax=Streptomyces europaeiscabiei TaxID=146819 RepID=UPI0029B91C02|nr:hypothetical protein [Streptomyces europaeiscabiei]MDX3713291.1 hypothetical protein [Streptomyces europaeiscabiei]MDX3836201.1 hypothetical protein [Streptomyces europaeiscabiei]
MRRQGRTSRDRSCGAPPAAAVPASGRRLRETVDRAVLAATDGRLPASSDVTTLNRAAAEAPDPGVVRWARLPRDTSVDEEEVLADTTATEEALQALPHLADELGTTPKVTEWLRQEYEAHLATVQAKGAGSDGDPALLHNRHYTDLRLALIAHKRATVVRLRDERHIDDTVLRRLQAALDNEEARLAGREPVE